MINAFRSAYGTYKFRSRFSLWLGVIAGLLYSSWPLGYILNPSVGRHDLASELEAANQPHHLVFVVMDVLSGLVITLACLLQLKISKMSKEVRGVVLGYTLFGLLVILAALTPPNCESLSLSCTLTTDPGAVIHGLCSTVSVILLLVSLVLAFREVHDAAPSNRVRRLFAGTSVCWAFCGVAGIIELLLHIQDYNALQYFFITLCSFSVALVIGGVEYLGRWHTLSKVVVDSEESHRQL